MSLTVQQLNADSCFLLTFNPSFAPKSFKGKFPGSFSILIDPWLDGASSIFHPKFATVYHTSPSALRSLQELRDEVDIILVSQDKPDHCHKETLCNLPKDSTTRIFATPKAAFKIREWRHFVDPSIIEEIPTYSPSKGEAAFTRIVIEPYSTSSAPGEITITHLSSKTDLTRLHNAIGITYCPPGTVLNTVDGDTINLSDLPMTSRPGSSIPPFKTIRHKPSISTVLSVLYTPHGIDPALLRPYVTSHLSRLPGAIPLTALFHSLNVESNPKLLGGVISKGAPGGIQIIKEVDAKYWVVAHDEVKKNEGVATKLMRSKVYGVDETIKMLRMIGGVAWTRGKKTMVECIGNGGCRTFRGG
ncbi:hypothetical protein CERZMDRAFT_43933 [Cercospora zeae-maydis SCOH1-5]|uniref:Metallo-beta-lactamase domain-containing protein n=1 Tax=Cercospora zeae-maydis SCOH1-5 TaxID=717836 RepID=A0A6A6FCA6_9PEZI|nr:hypothetical protein CERZMDRAFT_43933 [Cercospora zeae-maydis SCOH1-5]